ncbi:BTB/POZ domain-containing protein [Spatholobus suberectus]|nr:BTB/POZ domain-containing protein [Spatholobus suberectus]
MRLNDLEREHVCMKRDMAQSGSCKFMSSFSKKIGKHSLFGHSSSRGSSFSSRNPQRTDSKWLGIPAQNLQAHLLSHNELPKLGHAKFLPNLCSPQWYFYSASFGALARIKKHETCI